MINRNKPKWKKINNKIIAFKGLITPDSLFCDINEYTCKNKNKNVLIILL